MSPKSPEELLQEVRDSQVRIETTYDFLVRQYQGHHRTLYGEDGRGGLVYGQRRIETTLGVLMWVLGLAVPTATALAVVFLQKVA